MNMSNKKNYNQYDLAALVKKPDNPRLYNLISVVKNVLDEDVDISDSSEDYNKMDTSSSSIPKTQEESSSGSTD